MTWSSLASDAVARTYAAAAVVGGKVYRAGGGASGSSAVAVLSEYDPATDTWTTKSALPTATAKPVAGSVGGKLYVGMGEVSPSTVVSTWREYDPATDTWTTKSSTNALPRYAAAAFTIGTKIYVVAGATSTFVGDSSSAVRYYDTATDTWTAAAPWLSHTDLACCASGGYGWAAGGRDGSGIAQANFRRYDPVANTWLTRANIPSARFGHALTPLPDGRILLTGGYDNANTPQSTAYLYDPVANTWSNVTAEVLPATRLAHNMVTLDDGRVLVAGGEVGGVGTSATVLVNSTWSPGLPRTGTLTASPALSAVAVQSMARTGTLTAAPVLSATQTSTTYPARTGTITAAPVLTATQTNYPVAYRTGTLTAAPSLSAAAVSTLARTGTVSALPTLTAAQVGRLTRTGTLAPAPVLSAVQSIRMPRTGTVNASPVLSAIAAFPPLPLNEGLAVRLRVYAPNGADLGPLPAPQDLSVSFPLDDVGALTIAYDPDSPRSTLLGSPQEVAVETSADGGKTWSEPPSGRFLYLRDGRDPVRDDAYSVECPGYVSRLSKALVSYSGLNGDGRRQFIDATDGLILVTLLTEAQFRGALTGLTFDFTATVDSSGAAWSSTWSPSYEPGKDLLTVLTEMAALGRVDFRTNGRVLQVFNAGMTTGMGVDRTVGANPVSLRYGRDLTEAPFRRTWEGLADVALVGGDELSNVERANGGALKPWGRQETFVSAAGVSDAGTLSVIGDLTLQQTANSRTEHTFGLTFGDVPFYPFAHYAPGNWVWKSDQPGAPERMKVRQITLTRDSAGVVSGNVILNDLFLEWDVYQQRRINALLNGATQATAGLPSPVGNDILAPAQVLGLGGSSLAYLEGSTIRAQVTLDWADVTTNTDGTALTDLAHYEVHYRKGTTDPFALLTTTGASSLNWSPLEPDTLHQFRVRAVDTSNNWGAWSATHSLTTSADTLAPTAPATPTVTSRLGVAKVAWSGLNNAGGAMEADTAYVEVHASTTSGFTPSASTLRGYLTGVGEGVVTGFVRGTTIYVKLVAVDVSGNKSAASGQATHLVMGVDGPDMEFGSVTANSIDVGAVQFQHLQGDAIDAMTITLAAGGEIRTTATPSRGIKLDATNGFRGFNASGVRTFWLDPATGNVEFLGTIKAGSTITGTEFYTAVSGRRVVIRDNGSGGLVELGSTASEASLASIYANNDGGVPTLTLKSGSTASLTDRPELWLAPGDGGANKSFIYAGAALFQVPLEARFGTSVGGGVRFGNANVKLFRGMDAGNITANVDSNSRITIPHDIGSTPVLALATGDTTQGRHYDVFSRGASNITIQVRDAAGANLANGTSVSVNWLAIY